MTEKLLQFIWQFQYFNTKELFTAEQQRLLILHPGKLNTQQGPDFSDAKIKIENTVWAGNIELHIKTSDWLQHHHSTDKNYQNIILHVVWLNDASLNIAGLSFPTLELQPRISSLLLAHYEQLMHSFKAIPCEEHLPVLNEISWLAWKERLAAERLYNKSKAVLEVYEQSGNNWEEIFWRLLAKAFGMKTNGNVFAHVAETLPVNVLAKHKNQIHQLEALLLGQSGLLHKEHKDDYAKLLYKEYTYLAKKYKLKAVHQTPAFLRMRPANFPTIRLAQLAMLVHQSSHLFSKIKSASSVKELEQWLQVTANDFWHYHYKLNEASGYHPKTTGKLFTDSLIINTIIPVLFAYGVLHNDDACKQKAVQWLMEVSPEKNNITHLWMQHKVTNKNALESQALIHLKNDYCNYKKCLDCAVGNRLLKRDVVTS